jgi:protein TonB
MKISGLKLAFYVSLLVHGTAFSVIYAVQRASLSLPAAALVGNVQILEVTIESEPDSAPREPARFTESVTAAPSIVYAAEPVTSEPEIVSASPEEELFPFPWNDDPSVVAEPSEVVPVVGIPSESKNGAAIGASETATDRQVSGGNSLTGVAYLLNPKPIYPRESRRRKEQGIVLLEVLVSAEGCPQEICLKQSAGYRLLDDAALKAVKAWRFVPAQSGNVKIASRVEIPIRFQLSASL